MHLLFKYLGPVKIVRFSIFLPIRKTCNTYRNQCDIDIILKMLHQYDSQKRSARRKTDFATNDRTHAVFTALAIIFAVRVFSRIKILASVTIQITLNGGASNFKTLYLLLIIEHSFKLIKGSCNSVERFSNITRSCVNR